MTTLRKKQPRQKGKRQRHYLETATPHPALSRKGRGKDHDKDKVENGNDII
jgi:hypothetical protein